MRASIVVPVFGDPALTSACRWALLDTVGWGTGVEIILVDNGTGYPGATIVNDRNLGFAHACNQGAAAARGDWLVFLNNDTVPRQGWLDALLAAGDDPAVGIVGARLVYPDGRVQHAGVDVFFDERGILTGRHADARWAGKARDVDAVTGACMAVRWSCFENLGGFDEGYWNGYEDVDLCLEARFHRWRVVYEPSAVVVHHESASGPERWSKVRENIARLQERWAYRYPFGG